MFDCSVEIYIYTQATLSVLINDLGVTWTWEPSNDSLVVRQKYIPVPGFNGDIESFYNVLTMSYSLIEI